MSEENLNIKTINEVPFDERWISDKIKPEAVLFAEKFGIEIGPKYSKDNNAMTNTQIRNFFGEIKKIQSERAANILIPFLLLKPKLAYTAARFNDNQGVRKFAYIMNLALEGVKVKNNEPDRDQFENFVAFTESILAFHRYQTEVGCKSNSGDGDEKKSPRFDKPNTGYNSKNKNTHGNRK